EIEFDPTRDLLHHSEIEYRVPRRDNSRVIAIEPIVVDRAHAQRTAPAMPSRQRESGVRDEMRSAVYINAMITASKKSIGDFRKAAVERKMPCQLDRCLGFIAIGTAGSLELKAAIIRDVHFLVRVIDQEQIGAESEAPEIG